MVYLNLGCGDTYFAEWNNCDLLPRRYIESIDLRRSLPYADETFNAVYTAHLLEHLTPADGKRLITEMVRVLKPGGICRIVVPDLEGICRKYLQYLDQVVSEPSSTNAMRYRWMAN